MRYEAKHNHLKKLAQNIGNFINIALTLATRHQYSVLAMLQVARRLDGR
jgi:hypothetical protein